MDKESFFISLFNSKAIGDDAAVVGDRVYSADMFVENVHFKREWMSPYEIGYKAMAVNISDAIAMNADPRLAILCVGMPGDISPFEMRELARGVLECADLYGVEVIGGDTVSDSKISVSITLVSETKRPIFRTGIKPGYLLAYTGTLGESAKELKRALRGRRLKSDSRFKKPVLRDKFVAKAARYLKAAMDISDGLFEDLRKMLKSNSLGVKMLIDVKSDAGCSGEEYEILFAFDPKDLRAISKIAASTRTKVTVFGEAVRGKMPAICPKHHFKNRR